MESLTFRSLSFTSDTEIDLVLDADDGSMVTWRFTRTQQGDIGVINGPAEFTETYRQTPGPSLADWPEQLVRAAFGARRQPLPAGTAAQQAIDESRIALARRWTEARTSEE